MERTWPNLVIYLADFAKIRPNSANAKIGGALSNMAGFGRILAEHCQNLTGSWPNSPKSRLPGQLLDNLFATLEQLPRRPGSRGVTFRDGRRATFRNSRVTSLSCHNRPLQGRWHRNACAEVAPLDSGATALSQLPPRSAAFCRIVNVLRSSTDHTIVQRASG